jgi:hypothetical protein
MPGSLPYEWLGALALGILWLNTMLIAAAALRERRALGVVRASLADWRASGALVHGTIEEGRGPGGALAARHVEQIGRALTVAGPDRILFTDRGARAESYGGVLRTDGGETIEIEARAGEGVEVWATAVPPAREGDFDSAFSRASTNKGLAASIELRVERGARAWVHRDGDLLRITAMDPIAHCDRARARLAAFAAACPIGCGVVTAIALVPPVFGLVSTIGGALCLAFFLAVQPLGTAARDAARLPPRRLVGGTWQRPTT